MKVARIGPVALLLASIVGCGPNDPLKPASVPPPSPRPDFRDSAARDFNGTFDEAVVVADAAPPPVSGGTLITMSQGHRAALSDPDRDQVVVVDLDRLAVVATIHLGARDEPGRLVEDGAGLLHVALRQGGAVAAIDPVAGTLIRRDEVCQYPRGLAYAPSTDTLHVVCAGGELVSLGATSGEVLTSVTLDRDLRDVVIDGENLLVSHLRTPDIMIVNGGRVLGRIALPKITVAQSFIPRVAWRMIPAPGGGAIVAYQGHQVDPISLTNDGSYGGNRCGGIVRTAVALVGGPEKARWSATNLPSVLPVDVAIDAEDGKVLVASANAMPEAAFAPGPPVANFIPSPGTDIELPPPCPPRRTDAGGGKTWPWGQVVAIAIDAEGREIIQTRSPRPLLVVGGQPITLPGESREDTGHKLFHLSTAAGLACASCHPEGREDGHVWTFDGMGVRRTQSIGGGLLGTEPFHWDGDMTNFHMLSEDVFQSRMSGPALKEEHVTALAGWIDKIPAWKRQVPRDAEAAARGEALFRADAVGCAACHAGEKLTSSGTVDVGTGKAFQIPSLVGVAWRAPLLHNGCANTLNTRFDVQCGGGDAHGHVSALSERERLDLVAYLATL